MVCKLKKQVEQTKKLEKSSVRKSKVCSVHLKTLYPSAKRRQHHYTRMLKEWDTGAHNQHNHKGGSNTKDN